MTVKPRRLILVLSLICGALGEIQSSIPTEEVTAADVPVTTDYPASDVVDQSTHPYVDNPCVQPFDAGPCKSELIRYFYDQKTSRCRQFIYGGCQGNPNRFESEEECIARCTASLDLQSGHQVPEEGKLEGHEQVDGQGFLALSNSSGEYSFTFAAGYPYIQLTAAQLQAFELRLPRKVSFEFRTLEAQGLLLYHTLHNASPDEPKYELYVILEGGELKVIHVLGADETILLVGKGLNRDNWHQASILIDASRGIIEASIDNQNNRITVDGLSKYPSCDKDSNVGSVLFIGGMNWVQDEIESSYLFEHFVGCIRNIQLQTGTELEILKPLVSSQFRDIHLGCVDRCALEKNKCRHGSRCVNRYDKTTCDCFGTLYEGESCDYDNPSTITLRGYSYISYRIYDWKDRAHAESNRISMMFRAYVGDSILFYGGGTFPNTNHVAVTLLGNGSLYVEVDFGDGPNAATLGKDLITGSWHNFTLLHNGHIVDLVLDGVTHRVEAKTRSSRRFLRFDPHIYIGGDRKPLGLGLRSSNNFVGCLSQVYFNDVSIIYKLRVNAPQALYHGIFRPEFGECSDVQHIPITFPFPESEINLQIPSPPPFYKQQLDFRLGFKTRNYTTVLAHGKTSSEGTTGIWELRLTKGSAEFIIFPDASNSSNFVSVVNEGRRLSDGIWHQIHFRYNDEEASISVDYRRPGSSFVKQIIEQPLKLLPDLVIGASVVEPHLGFVGCMRELVINNEKHDPRVILSTANVREISLDNCQLVDPCRRPNACEHGGQCMVNEGRVVCDCTGTGYTGKNCHFALYKRTCEELALLGYMKSGVYEIDIDGNGPHPPAHVRCEFDAVTGVRKTVVQHNLLPDFEIRSRNRIDSVFNLTYREFTAEMLQSLISQSLQCRQHFRYDCYKAPLDLRSYTWFRSSSGNYLDYVGSALPGRCPCSRNKTCSRADVFCNCDANENRWDFDEGYLRKPEELGITQIFALQQKNLPAQGEGRITLGPLECVEANTQQYVVTFKSRDSYMEVPGWHRGDLAFSFRTTSDRAILLYQPLLHPKHPYFRVILENEFELTLEFSINGEPRNATVKSSRDMNSGEWQQVWIDYNEYHVRFTVNQESILMDLNEGEEFGPFEATLFIGGAPEEMLDVRHINFSKGLIGCFRGLVMNNEVVNLYAYMNARFPDMIQKHCRPSCDPNPCRNGATCVEYWGSYKCICENPYAHFGQNCQLDINENGLTFRSADSFVEANATSLSEAASLGLDVILTQDILLNLRTYDTHSLVLYAYDYLNNFVQLHIADGRIFFTFNSGRVIHQVSVPLGNNIAGSSTQLLVDREPDGTTLHVNGVSSTVEAPVQLLTKYYRNPWLNQQKELVKPPRPVRRPQEFYQVFLGSVDKEYMETSLRGYTGCLRGLKIGDTLLDLTTQYADGASHDLASFLLGDDHSVINPGWMAKTHETIPGTGDVWPGVTHGCNMLCDRQPCKNGGSCIENFLSNSYSCDCEFTSYMGPTCTDEKGAQFSGESYIIAQHSATDLDSVRVQMAFSASSFRNIAQALLLIQTSNDKTKYLLVSLTALGYLRIEEDRGAGVVYGAEVKTINFLNGARHSIYYKRQGDSAFLLVDRNEVALRSLMTSIHTDGLVAVTDDNALHVGGIRSSNDPRFVDYDHFDGCISNVVVELDGKELRPILAYLGYQRTGMDVVTSHDPEGIEEEARCAAFSISPPGVVEEAMDSSNDTLDQDWIPNVLVSAKYKPVFEPKPEYDPTQMNRALVGLVCAFLALFITLGLYLWNTHRRSKKRKYLMEDERPLIAPAANPVVRPNVPKPRPPPPTKPVAPTTLPAKVDIVHEDATTTETSGKTPKEGQQAPIISLIDIDNALVELAKDEESSQSAGSSSTLAEASGTSSDSVSSGSSSASLDSDADTGNLINVNGHSAPNDNSSEDTLLEDGEKAKEEEDDPPCVNGGAPLVPITEENLPDDLTKEENKETVNNHDLSDDHEAAGRPLTEELPHVTPELKSRPTHYRSKSADESALTSPIFISEDVRTFANPISYLGGPRLSSKNFPRASKESVLSIDE